MTFFKDRSALHNYDEASYCVLSDINTSKSKDNRNDIQRRQVMF